MKLKIILIETNEYIKIFKNISAFHSKWLISFFHNLKKKPTCYLVEDFITNEQIGLAYSIPINNNKDFSLIILPEYQRKGFGIALIYYLLENYENASFTVSRSNIPMLNLFDKVSLKQSLTIEHIDLKRVQFIQSKTEIYFSNK
jgi:GNAT superfamily N-acetyltransferase